MESRCSHPGLAQPKFDEEMAKGMTVEQIRKHFPRGYEWCHDCQSNVILYASYAHYIYGDW